jgi:hypothetical protein
VAEQAVAEENETLRQRNEQEKEQAGQLARELIDRMTQDGADAQAWRGRAEAMLAEAPIAVDLPRRRHGSAKIVAVSVAAGLAGVIGMLVLTNGNLPFAQKPVAKAVVLQTPAEPAKLQMSFSLSAPAASGDSQ